MNSQHMQVVHRIGMMALIIAVGTVAGGGPLDLGSQIAKQIRYPDYDDKGQLKFEVLGDKAQVLPDGLIRVVNLKLILYEDGKAMMEVTAPECLLDRVKRIARSTSDVCAARSEIVLTGRGYELTWDNNKGHLEIYSRAKVVLTKETFREDRSFRPSDTNKTAITSTRLSFDQQQRTAVFEEDVVVIDPQVKITADKLTILFSPDNTVTNIEAQGHVVIQQEDKKAMGKQVQYEVGEGKFVLTGNPVIQSGRDMLSADIITFWRKINRILCEPNARLVIRSEQNVFEDGFTKE